MFLPYVKQRRLAIMAFVLFFVIYFVSFELYSLPLKAVIYPGICCLVIGVVCFAVDYHRAKAKHDCLRALKAESAAVLGSFPPAETVDDDDYRLIIKMLCEEQLALNNRVTGSYNDMVDYYTAWAHQIKTPIASMRLNLQTEDSALSRKLSSDLNRIEQYVEMVLTFLRLDSESTDYVFREYELDDILRQSVKKFSGDFIIRRLKLNYEPVGLRIVTDGKWLAFVIEQVLSNALKYTQSGSISVYIEDGAVLCISDTGIGVAPEDLPRIFEKGYTGFNGREYKKATGIGLYLCRRICRNLGVRISAESEPDVGTTVKIDLSQKRADAE